jgi:hypothetical protein
MRQLATAARPHIIDRFNDYWACAATLCNAGRAPNLHISRGIRFSGEMWLNRLDDRPQGNSQTIAQGRLFKL